MLGPAVCRVLGQYSITAVQIGQCCALVSHWSAALCQKSAETRAAATRCKHAFKMVEAEQFVSAVHIMVYFYPLFGGGGVN